MWSLAGQLCKPPTKQISDWCKRCKIYIRQAKKRKAMWKNLEAPMKPTQNQCASEWTRAALLNTQEAQWIESTLHDVLQVWDCATDGPRLQEQRQGKLKNCRNYGLAKKHQLVSAPAWDAQVFLTASGRGGDRQRCSAMIFSAAQRAPDHSPNVSAPSPSVNVM